MPTWLAIIGGATTAVVGLTVFIGLVVKWVVMPNLREQLVKPVTEALDGVTKAFDDHLAWSTAFEVAVRQKIPDFPVIPSIRR